MKVITKDNLSQASIILKHGGIVAFPTETVYGLGVRADKEECYEKLVEVKHRRPNQPFTVMCSDINMIEKFLVVDKTTRTIIDKFMPGPLTLILKTSKDVAHHLDLGTGFVGVRIPKSKTVLDLINQVGVPLLVPSANPTGEEPALNSIDVIKYFNDKIDCVIEGECKSNTPSTIIKIDEGNVTLIRKGEIELETILEAIK